MSSSSPPLTSPLPNDHTWDPLLEDGSTSHSRFYTLVFFIILLLGFLFHISDFCWNVHLKHIPWIQRLTRSGVETSHFTDIEAGRRAAIRRKQEETASLAAIASEKQRVKDLEELERQAENIRLRPVNALPVSQGQRLVEKSTPIQKIPVTATSTTSTASNISNSESSSLSSSPPPTSLPRIPKIVPLSESEITLRRIKIASMRLTSEPAVDAEGVITLAIRCISWRGELRDERRFLNSDTIENVADFVQTSSAFEIDGGMKNAALFTVFPRKCLLDWKEYYLSNITTKSDFESFERNDGQSLNKNGQATLLELGLSGRTVLSLVRATL